MRAGVAFVSAPGYEAPAGAEDEIPLRATWKRRLPIEGSFRFFSSVKSDGANSAWTEQIESDEAGCLLGVAVMDDIMVMRNKPVDSLEFL